MLTVHIKKSLPSFPIDVAFEAPARVTALFGPTGSGKTTILNCVAGIDRADRAHVAFNGSAWQDDAVPAFVPPRRRRVGYVFQNALLFPHLSVRDNLLYGHSSSNSGPAFDDVVGVLGLRDLLARRPDQLSGGQQRQAAVARALLSNPALLLLDEPLAGLDAAAADKTMVYLKHVLDTFQICALYVSHSITDVRFLCEDVVVLDRGRVIAQAAPNDVLIRARVLTDLQFHELRNVFTVPVIDASPADGAVRCRLRDHVLTIYGSPPDREQITLSIGATDILLASGELNVRLSARNLIPAVVTRIERVGARILVFLDVGIEWIVEIGAAAHAELALAPGAKVLAVVKATAIRLI